MRSEHATYEEAYTEARARANEHGRDFGLEKGREYGRTVWRVKPIPRPENCYGHEARMQRVTPGE